MRGTLRLRDAALWVIGAGIAAQFAGGITADVLRSYFTSRGASPEQIANAPGVVIPAIVASSCVLLALIVFAALMAGAPLRQALGLRRAAPSVYALAVLGTVLLGPTADFMMRLAAQLFPEATLGVVPMLNELVAGTSLLIVWPAFALMPGVAEELAFRGLLQEAAGRTGRAIAISGVGFALFHVDPHHVAGVVPLGLFLAWVGARSSTYVTVVAHVVNNSADIALARSEAVIGYGNDDPVPLSWLLGSLVLVAICAVLLARATSRDRSHDDPQLAL